jgi:poly(hydroxyalkanoate) granule-associated protein
MDGSAAYRDGSFCGYLRGGAVGGQRGAQAQDEPLLATIDGVPAFVNYLNLGLTQCSKGRGIRDNRQINSSCGCGREGASMAARKKKTVKPGTRKTRSPKATAQGALIENVQQIWLAGMGAVAKAQKEGPAAFEDAVAEGFKLLTRSRSNAEEMIREALETAQESVQAKFGSARDQATETWDNLETLFQSRVHKAMNQLGVPTAEEIRVLTRRVGELNATVKTLSAKQARAKRSAGKAPAKRRARAKTAR